VEVTIRCYGAVEDAVGRGPFARVLEADATAGDVVEGLATEFDSFDPSTLPGHFTYRVNGAAADRNTHLADGDVVVLSLHADAE
jgi:molybdopterin converting factor small subunit